MFESKDTTAGVTALSSRILANRPMVKINGNVQYLSSGTSMIHAGGNVVGLFKNTWMRACGVGKLQEDGSRKINKMGNIELLLDVDKERSAFDLAVIKTIRTAIPEFDTQISLESFYQELMQITGDDASLVRRGVSSSLGKIAAEDLLLSGALSKDSPFFTKTTVGKAIRQKGIEKYGIIEVREECDSTDVPVIVDYPAISDPDFDKLTDAHLPNNMLSNVPTPQASMLNLTRHTKTNSSSNLYLRILSGISLVLGAAALIVAFAALNVATLGTAGGVALAVIGGIAFFGGGIGLAASLRKNSDANQLAPEKLGL